MRTTDHGCAPASPAEQSERRSAAAAASRRELGALAQMLLAQDRAEIAAAMASASNAAALTDIRYFTQRGLFSSRILEAARHRAAARRPRRADREQPGADAERLHGGDRQPARDRPRDGVAGAAALRPRGSRKPAQRDPAQRADGAARAAPDRADARADPPDRAPPARALQQAAQAAAPRPSRCPPNHPPQCRLGRHSVSHRLEAPPPRQAEDRRDLRRLGLGGAGVGLLPAADPQPA